MTFLGVLGLFTAKLDRMVFAAKIISFWLNYWVFVTYGTFFPPPKQIETKNARNRCGTKGNSHFLAREFI